MKDEVLYRIRDASGTLLYIGITNDVGARIQQHEASKPWFSDAHSIEIERHPTRAEVAEAERQAVRSENPIYNTVRFSGPTKLRTFRVPDDLWVAARSTAEAQGQSVTSVILAGLQEYVDVE